MSIKDINKFRTKHKAIKKHFTRQISHDITYMWNLKKRIKINLAAQQKHTPRL